MSLVIRQSAADPRQGGCGLSSMRPPATAGSSFVNLTGSVLTTLPPAWCLQIPGLSFLASSNQLLASTSSAPCLSTRTAPLASPKASLVSAGAVLPKVHLAPRHHVTPFLNNTDRCFNPTLLGPHPCSQACSFHLWKTSLFTCLVPCFSRVIFPIIPRALRRFQWPSF